MDSSVVVISSYQPDMFDDAVDIFAQMSAYYLRENASDKSTVARNLQENVLAPHSAMQILLAYYDNQVCALAAYTIMYPATKETGQLFLKELFVSPDFSRLGVGEKIMGHLSRVAIEKNCSRFDWTANEDSPAAVAFYKKLQAPIIEKKKYYRLTRDDLKRVAKTY